MNLLPAAHFQPHRFGAVEAAIMRVLLVAVVWWSLPLASEVADLTGQKKPTGLATLFPLTWLATPGIFLVCQILIGAAALLYIANRLLLITTGVMTLVHVLIFTLDNSQGATNHAYQLISLVLLAQFLTYLSPHVIRRIERWKKITLPRLFGTDKGIRLSDLALYFSQQTIAAAYVVAGVSKLIRSKGLWVWQSPNVSVELIKTNAQNFYNRLDTDATYEHRLQVAQWMIDNPMITRVLMGGGLVIELFAFLALRSRLGALLTGLAIVALHYGIYISMGLFFKYNIAIVIIFFINLPYWIGKLFPTSKPLYDDGGASTSAAS
jgi:hypothetical protein